MMIFQLNILIHKGHINEIYNLLSQISTKNIDMYGPASSVNYIEHTIDLPLKSSFSNGDKLLNIYSNKFCCALV